MHVSRFASQSALNNRLRNLSPAVAFALVLALLTAVVGSAPAKTGPLEAASCSAALGQPVNENLPGLAGPIRLMSWNIQKTQTAGWDTDLQTIGEDRNLLLIQEASTESMISAALPQPLYQAFAAGYTTRSQTTGVLTLSSVAPTVQCNLTAWEPWLGTPKATNITEYPLAESEQRLLVINLHAVNFAVGMVDFTAQVGALAPLLEKHEGPVLVAGDFNTWSGNRHTHLQQFMSSHELTPVNFAPDHRSTFLDRPLDHIYLRGLNPLEASTVAVNSSDHNPLLTTLEIHL